MSDGTSSAETEYRERLKQALGDGYVLRDLIGRGGFAGVYAARDLKLDREVAVKALRHDVFPTPALLKRFQQEAKAVANLRHPNIVPVHTVGEGQGIAFMVMPLVEGESLRELMDGEGTVPVEETVRIIGQVAIALEAAHKRGFVHRDVKPANIMLDGEERNVLLMDFGIAKTVSAEDTGMTGTGMVIGSPEYMSPEQAAGERDVDGRSDIYSLGGVAYQMLSGRLPFPAGSLHELVYKQVTEKVPDLAEIAPNVPPDVARAVMRCLAGDREDRWQTAADFGRAITTGGSATMIPGQAAIDEEDSWLSRRGPYVFLLSFLLYFTSFFKGEMRAGFGSEAYSEWAVGPLLEFSAVAVILLLVAAVADVLVRMGIRLKRGRSWRQLGRFLLGQPDWWQAWYPRSLRVRDSVWDRLPFSMKLLRTLVWKFPRWHAEHGISRLELSGSLFNLRGSYWQGSRVRAILRD